MVSINWGVYGLPETFIIDKEQKIIYRHVGAITEKDMKKIKLILGKKMRLLTLILIFFQQI